MSLADLLFDYPLGDFLEEADMAALADDGHGNVDADFTSAEVPVDARVVDSDPDYFRPSWAARWPDVMAVTATDPDDGVYGVAWRTWGRRKPVVAGTVRLLLRPTFEESQS